MREFLDGILVGSCLMYWFVRWLFKDETMKG